MNLQVNVTLLCRFSLSRNYTYSIKYLFTILKDVKSISAVGEILFFFTCYWQKTLFAIILLFLRKLVSKYWNLVTFSKNVVDVIIGSWKDRKNIDTKMKTLVCYDVKCCIHCKWYQWTTNFLKALSPWENPWKFIVQNLSLLFFASTPIHFYFFRKES